MRRGARAKADAALSGAGVKPADGPRVLHAVESNGPKPADLANMYLEAKALKEKVTTANGRYREFLKQCGERGLEPAVITRMMAWERQDPDEARSFWRQFGSLHEATNQSIQLDLFGNAAGGGVSREAEVFDAGFKCGHRGGNTSESQWDAGTPLGQIWLGGYQAGNAKLAQSMWGNDKPVVETTVNGVRETSEPFLDEKLDAAAVH